jgi:hypothetical protein
MPQALPLQRCFNEQPILGSCPLAEMNSVQESHRRIGGALQHARACNERIMAHLYSLDPARGCQIATIQADG